MNADRIRDISRELDEFREKYRRFNQRIQEMSFSGEWCTENSVIYREGPVILREFHSAGRAEGVPVLIVYSHVNRPDIIDIDEKHSMVRRLMETGNRVYVMDWQRTGVGDQDNDLSVYVVDAIGGAIDQVSRATGHERINLVGICQGGTFALCHACLRPQKIRRLGLVVTPVDFHAGDSLIRHWSRRVRFDRLVEDPVNIPGELITLMFQFARPFDDLQRQVEQVDGVERNERLAFTLRMDRWVYDCPDQPGRAFAQFMGGLYQDNRLVQGGFEIGGETADARTLSVPVLNLYAENDHLVPPESSAALGKLLDESQYEEIRFSGGHIGLIVSSRAQREVHPALGRWLSGA